MFIEPDRRRYILVGLPDGRGGHRAGAGRPGKTEFPEDWTDDEIIDAIESIANDDHSKRYESRGDVAIEGSRRALLIRVILRHGRIWTAYPLHRSGG